MSSALILYNPESGNQESEEVALYLRESLQFKHQEIKLKASQKPDDLIFFTQKAAEEDYERIYILGGDGSVHEVVNAIAELKTCPTIGVIPTGTVNNCARMLNMPVNPWQAAERIGQAQKRKIDIGKINNQYFVSTISAGSLPQSAAETSSELKEQLGPAAYLVEGLQALQDEEAKKYNLVLDGTKITDEYSLFLVALGNSVLGIENFFPEASLNDGFLSVFGLKETTLLEKLSLLPDWFRESEVDSEQFIKGRYQEIILAADEGEEIETTVDGDPGPSSPLTISILPSHLSFLFLEDK